MEMRDLRLEVQRLVEAPGALMERETEAEQHAFEGGIGPHELQALQARVLALTVANYGKAILLLTEALAARGDDDSVHPAGARAVDVRDRSAVDQAGL
jgi:hypothetical protein